MPPLPTIDVKTTLLQQLRTLGLEPVGEHSCKMQGGELLIDRFLLGIPLTEIPLQDIKTVLSEFSMPTEGQELIYQQLAGASEIQFAMERHKGEIRCKVYLEYWDRVVQQVNQKNYRPTLLNFGIKWNPAKADVLTVDRYLCYPLLTTKEIIQRITTLHKPTADAVGALLQAVSSSLSQRDLIYLEVDSGDNQRRSYDINLYKCGRTVGDIGPYLLNLAPFYGVAVEQLERVLSNIKTSPLGHISAGIDRKGLPFFTFYYEVNEL